MKMLIIKLTLFSILHSVVSFNISDFTVEKNSAKMIYACAGAIIRHFRDHKARTIYYSFNKALKYRVPLNLMFNEISKKGRWSWTIADECVTTGVVTPLPTGFVLYTNGNSTNQLLNSIQMQINDISCNSIHWKPSLRMLVCLILEYYFNENQYLLAESAIQLLWNNSVYYGDVMIMSEGGNSGTIYRANPFHPANNCGHRVKVVEELYRCSKERFSNHYIESPFTNPDRFPNCTFNVLLKISPPYVYKTGPHQVSGSDVKFLLFLEEYLGFNMTIIHKHNQNFNISVFDRLFNDLSNNDIDLGIGGIPLLEDFYYKVHFLSSYDSTALRFYLPKPRIVRWRMFIKVFRLNTWCFIIATVFLNTILIYYFKFKKYLKEKSISFFTVVAIMSQQSQLIPNNVYFRMLISGFLITLFLISTVFTSLIHSFTINPPHENYILTLAQLQKKHLNIALTPITHYFVERLNNTKEVNITKWKVIINLKKLADEMLLTREWTLLTRENAMKLLLTKFNCDIYSVKEPFSSVQITAVMPKGNVYRYRIDSLIKRLLENGLFSSWQHQNISDSVIKFRELRKLNNKFRKLKIEDIMPIIHLLFYGNLIATIVFFMEILLAIVKRYKTKKKKLNYIAPYEFIL
ncbi:hypothetical protein O3M35_007197 [Rhynocoris fuscipes]|uniref:Uncharacterized protein n=1 Tax=Rhynocoris fuscipes TaxID=488301 RepID=A0AAW1DE75_9HEMI